MTKANHTYDLNKIVTLKDDKYNWSCFSVNIMVRGNVYRISQHSYSTKSERIVEICKLTNNPFGGHIGKSYKSWDAAIAAYKLPEMKTGLVLAQSSFMSFEIEKELARLALNN